MGMKSASAGTVMSVAQQTAALRPARSLKAGEEHAFIRTYRNVFIFVFVCTFIASWKYAISEVGGIVGYGLGWIPALVIALIFAGMWPLGVLLGGIAFFVMRFTQVM
jgi:hypothetical protein